MLELINLVLQVAEAAAEHTAVITAPSAEPAPAFCTAAAAHAAPRTLFCHGNHLKTQMSSGFFKHICPENWRQGVICPGQLGAGSLQSWCSCFLPMV